MLRVLLTGWQPGLDKVALTRVLRTRSGMTLSEAHACVGRLLADEVVVVETTNSDAAESLAAEASRLGAAAKIERPISSA